MTRQGTNKRDEFCGRPRLTYHDAEHLPHWTVSGDGWCSVEFTLYDQGLSMDTIEARTANGRTTTKRTMETLDDAATRALYEILRERYGQ